MIIQTHTIVCDGCGQWSTTQGAETPELAWEHATLYGWTRVRTDATAADPWGGLDYHCGTCTGRRRAAARDARQAAGHASSRV